MKRIITLSLLVLATTLSVVAQERTLTGTITGADDGLYPARGYRGGEGHQRGNRL
ncbi:MAG: hypothetical protein IPH20_08865 [Bacteroidales bacterium]|nr:hypothetical protein [Bacteroidales bacterium]